MEQSVLVNDLRNGNFTSSQIYRLLASATVRNTYIQNKKIERRLQRSLELDKYSPAAAWGTFMQYRVFDLMPDFEYQLNSKNTTRQHPQIKCWVGTEDLLNPNKKVGEIKCYEPKNFALYTDALLKKDIEYLRKECAEEYWQIVSNAIINNVQIGEGICYMPYKSELPAIREMVENYDGGDMWKYRFIYEKQDIELPHLPDNGYYKNLNSFEFEIPKEDIELLTNAVLKAEKELITN